jgi:hypothetical protein
MDPCRDLFSNRFGRPGIAQQRNEKGIHVLGATEVGDDRRRLWGDPCLAQEADSGPVRRPLGALLGMEAPNTTIDRIYGRSLLPLAAERNSVRCKAARAAGSQVCARRAGPAAALCPLDR